MKYNRLALTLCGLGLGMVSSLTQAQLMDRSTQSEKLQTTISQPATTQPQAAKSQYAYIKGVKTEMQRMLRSQDGQYFLQLNAGVWNPNARLNFINIEREIYFEGRQKGNDLNLSSVPLQASEPSAGEYLLNGVLDANRGSFKTQLIQRGLSPAAVQFEPAFKVANKPTFVFRYLSNFHKQNQLIERIEVVDKASNQVLQTLSGFSADPSLVRYMDVNFDGYYDLVLKDARVSVDPYQQAYIYWMYNPKTQRFQRSSQMEKLTGTPQLNGLKQQIDFGDGRAYQVSNGLLNAIHAQE